MESKWVRRVADWTRILRKAGPYVALEIVMPGGTLLALLLYLHRSGRLRDAANAGSRALDLAAERTFEPIAQAYGGTAAVVQRRPRVGGRDELAPLDLMSTRRITA